MNDNEVRKTNIVFILADDQGAWAMGCSGNPEIKTPNLDTLAAMGVRFDRFFCTSPVCSPARASLLTGRMPSRHGVHDWIKSGNIGDGSVEYLHQHLAYTDVLAEAGYHCGISGKWHLGDSRRPQKSFSHWYVHQTGGGPYYDAPMVRDGELIKEPAYVTDRITDDALAYIESRSQSNQPFYLSVHYTAPHFPWIGQHPDEYVRQYDGCAFESCPDEPPHRWSVPASVPAQTRIKRVESLQGYFAAVTAMDANIGRILKALEALHLREDTLVCFLSDNGFNCGHHGIWGKGNGTFPLNMYDNSILVPAILSQPGRTRSGLVTSRLVSGYDIMPTLLEYVGIENPVADFLPGRSFASALTGSGADEREHVVVYDEYGPVRMIRNNKWKYVHRYPYGPNELYDLVNDPDERANVVGDRARQRVTAEMRGAMEDWFNQHTDPRIAGTHEAVTGRGQLGLAGAVRGDLPAFSDDGVQLPIWPGQ